MSMTSETLLCRLYNGNVESVTHIISACLNMEKNHDLKRQDKVKNLVCKKFLLECNNERYEHVLNSVLENKHAKSCGIFLSKLTSLLNIDGLVLYAWAK